MSDTRRLIEVAFPLEQTSIDSVHEKNVRHGHISTLHIWPARRPLAASRAALIATLLPDPGTPEKRRELVERLGGRVVKVLKKKHGPGGGEEKVVKETVGGILHWGRETANRADLDFFRAEIRKAYGGRGPRILDPFAGGGAIPLEAIRLGCDVTAIDINPVAWFILKCTLEYPQKLAGQKRPLPDFVRSDREFMEAFFKAQGMKGAMLRSQLLKLRLGDRKTPSVEPELPGLAEADAACLAIEEHTLEADLAWHVRAWGWWVLQHTRRDLAKYYPVYADWQPLKEVDDWRAKHPEQARPMQLVPLRDDGTADVGALNAHLSAEELADERKPRWVAKPAVAYLWARTVTCKHCRATIPLLKTRWLAKKDTKRVLLTLEPNPDKTGVVFGVEQDVAVVGGNNAQRREHDRRAGQGTMSRSGAWCPCCAQPGGVTMSMEDIRAEGMAGRLGTILTTVVVQQAKGKHYRLPTDLERDRAASDDAAAKNAFASIEFGIPDEPLPAKEALGVRVPLYGLDRWRKLFTDRQLIALAGFIRSLAAVADQDDQFGGAVVAYLALAIDRVANRCSTQCIWNTRAQEIEQTFARFALPILWDFAESSPLQDASGSFRGEVEWVAAVCSHLTNATAEAPVAPTVLNGSAKSVGLVAQAYDAVVTDPPYYDAIPYSDLMDFFYIWLRRTLVTARFPGIDDLFREPLGPKWNTDTDDGELIDDPSRHAENRSVSRAVYERGMKQAFSNARKALRDGGRLVVVFANKQPAAWEALVTSIIEAGFAVDGSWPIQTERSGRMRATGSAALASSVWLTCRTRPIGARPGWDNVVLQEMRTNIRQQLRDFWDAGIHGPDFVWAATGPALEAYSKHPIVKKANAPGETMGVGEFLKSVRRLVVEFVVGRVLGEGSHVGAEEGSTAAAGLDDVTTYYLLHRYDFKMNDAPAGACILYALSCNLSESELADRYDILFRTGGVEADDDAESGEEGEEASAEPEEGSGSTFKLKPWRQRRRPTLGIDPVAEQARRAREEFEAQGPALFEEAEPDGVAVRSRVIPLIDSIHHLMHLWLVGDAIKVNDYLDDRGLRRSETFRQVLQALIELAEAGGEERSVLESLSNHVRALGERADTLLDRTRG